MANEKEIQSTIAKLDELFSKVEAFRNGKAFRKFMKFCSSFRMVGAYNAMLIETQREGVQYALTAAGWKKYNRRPKPDSRPMVILMPFAPVDFVFDVSDTEHIPGTEVKEYEAELNRLSQPFKAEGKVVEREYDNLRSNLKYLGIKLNDELFAGGSLAGKIYRYDGEELETIMVRGKPFGVRFPYYFRLCVNSNESTEEQFVTVCHELGHYFCKHLVPPTPDWWEPRSVPNIQEEFEAECVAWLVCSRHGVESKSSVEYLAGLLDKYESVPQVAMGTISSAVDRIERLFSKMTPSASDLYKYSDGFYTQITGKKRRRRPSKPR